MFTYIFFYFRVDEEELSIKKKKVVGYDFHGFNNWQFNIFKYILIVKYNFFNKHILLLSYVNICSINYLIESVQTNKMTCTKL